MREYQTRKQLAVTGKERVALYARVSSESQAGEDKTSLIEQVESMLNFCIREDKEVAGVYKEVGRGTTKNRPEFQRMLNDARDGAFDAILCWKPRPAESRYVSGDGHNGSSRELRHQAIDRERRIEVKKYRTRKRMATTGKERVALYARVSSESQAGEDKTSLKEQVESMLDFCVREDKKVAGVYKEVGRGTTKKPPRIPTDAQ